MKNEFVVGEAAATPSTLFLEGGKLARDDYVILRDIETQTDPPGRSSISIQDNNQTPRSYNTAEDAIAAINALGSLKNMASNRSASVVSFNSPITPTLKCKYLANTIRRHFCSRRSG